MSPHLQIKNNMNFIGYSVFVEKLAREDTKIWFLSLCSCAIVSALTYSIGGDNITNEHLTHGPAKEMKKTRQ